MVEDEESGVAAQFYSRKPWPEVPLPSLFFSSSVGGKGTGYFIKPCLSLLNYSGLVGIWGTFFIL